MMLRLGSVEMEDVEDWLAFSECFWAKPFVEALRGVDEVLLVSLSRFENACHSLEGWDSAEGARSTGANGLSAG